mgnify:CR=1 FL=1
MAITINSCDGAMVVVVSCVMALLVLLSTIQVRSSIQTLEVALQRVSYEQRLRSFSSLISYSDGMLNAYSKSLEKLPTGTRIVHFIDAWPLQSKNEYKATIIIEIQRDAIVATITLFKREDLQEIVKSYTKG